MSLSKIILEWGNAYVKDFQERFLPTLEKYLREQIPELEDYEIIWESQFLTKGDSE